MYIAIFWNKSEVGLKHYFHFAAWMEKIPEKSKLDFGLNQMTPPAELYDELYDETKAEIRVLLETAELCLGCTILQPTFR